MKFGLPISASLHGVAFALMWVTFDTVAPVPIADRYVPVELVELGDSTNIRATRKSKKPVPDEDIILPPTSKDPDGPVVIDETPDSKDTPLIPDKVDDIADPSEATKKDGDAIGKDPVKDDVSEDANADEVIEDDDTSKSASADATKSDKTKKKTSFSLDDISSQVNKARKDNPNANTQTLLKSEETRIQFSTVARAGAGEATGLSASLEDRLQQELQKCWRLPAGAVNPEELIVEVLIKLDMAGEVMSADLVDPTRIARHPNRYMSVAAERAVTAVSKCSPYDFLPREDYAVWKEFTFNFIPEL